MTALALPGLADIDFEPPKAGMEGRPGRSFLMFVLDTNVIAELREAGDDRATRMG